MKLYNIHNTREFFEKLNKCEGIVELVDDKGGRRQLLKEMDRRDEPLTYSQIDGTISQIELKFHNDNDCHNILCWLINKRHIA